MATRVSTKHYLDSEHSSSITRRLIVFPGSTTSLLPEHCRIYTVSIKIKKLSHRRKSCRDLLYLKQGQSWHSARRQFKGRKSQWRTTTTTVSCGNTSSCTSMLWLKFLKASLEWERNRDGEINAEQWQYPWFGLYTFFIPLPHTLNNPLLNPPLCPYTRPWTLPSTPGRCTHSSNTQQTSLSPSLSSSQRNK